MTSNSFMSDEGEVDVPMTVDEAARAARLEREIRRRHANLSYLRDAISDLMLTSQFQEADFTQRSAQLQKLLQQASAAGGAAGRIGKGKRDNNDLDLMTKALNMTDQLELFESRTSQARDANAGLEKIINELRRERAQQQNTMRQRGEREGAMATDMRQFATTAHAALDEKERIKGRVRRLKHEWKLERAQQETEQMQLQRTLVDLEAAIETMQMEEETERQDATRLECREMREAYKVVEVRERRLGYLRAQSAALSNEFRKLGEVAGVTGGRGRDERGGSKFNHEDPQTADVLINTLKQNDIRNESGHAYLQELDGEVESLSSELSKLDKEEKQLIALEAKVATAQEEKGLLAEKEHATAVEEEARYEQLHAKLAVLRPQLTTVVGRLLRSYEGLEDAEVPTLQKIPARSLPEGLKPLPIDQMPLEMGVEVELEHLDGLFQSLSSRVTRIVLERASDAAEKSLADDEPPPVLNPNLKLFVELPEEYTFTQLKNERAELELVVARRKEEDDP